MAATYLLEPVELKKLRTGQPMDRLTNQVSRVSPSSVRYWLLFQKIKIHLDRSSRQACQVLERESVLGETPDQALRQIAAT